MVTPAGKCYKAKFPYHSVFIRQDSNKGFNPVCAFCAWRPPSEADAGLLGVQEQELLRWPRGNPYVALRFSRPLSSVAQPKSTRSSSYCR
jgi:hypothetical protein